MSEKKPSVAAVRAANRILASKPKAPASMEKAGIVWTVQWSELRALARATIAANRILRNPKPSSPRNGEQT